jgi:V/A-type H+-transporting ATPase subunit E
LKPRPLPRLGGSRRKAVEVLRTSEELEKQILEDARKKAHRILESADKECAAIRAEWAKKLEEESARMEEDARKQMKALQNELEASLPLDFMRARLSFIEEALRTQLRALFGGFSAKEKAEIIAALVNRVEPLFKGKTVIAGVNGITAQEAEKILRGTPGVTLQGVKALPAEMGEGIVLETPDGKIRYRGTFAELQERLLEEHREELKLALLGKDV